MNEKKENVDGYAEADNSSIVKEDSGISMLDIWHMFKKHWVGIVAITLTSLLIGTVYNFGFKGPVWKSQGSAMVIAKANDGSDPNQNLNYSLSLLTTVKDFMNDEVVLTAVAKDVNKLTDSKGKQYNLDYIKLKKIITCTPRTFGNLERSLYIDVSAKTDNEVLSKALVDSLLTNSQKIANTTDNPDLSYFKILKDVINVTSYGSKPKDDAMSGVLILAISAGAGLVIGLLYAVAFDMFNTKVSNTAELESITGYKVIGVIPDNISGKKEEDKRKKEQNKREEK
ncbi:MAG: hypothetical protein RRZ92_04315 [Bacilli bacterium]